MNEVACPRCKAQLVVRDAEYPFLSCPQCLARIRNPNLAQPPPLPPAPRRRWRVDERARRDRQWTGAALGLLAGFGILGVAAVGADWGLWLLAAGVVVWGLAVSLSGSDDAAGTFARIVLGMFAVVGVFVVLAVCVLVFLFVQCLHRGFMN